MADEQAVTYVPEVPVGAVTIYSEDGTESHKFHAGVPAVDLPKGVLSRIEGADKNTVDGHKFEIVKASTAERRHGSAPESAT